jgi:predicted transcriptional regulator
MVIDDKELNENDKKLLAICRGKPHAINDLARLLNISPASVSVKVADLESRGLLNVTRRGKGQKTIVITKGEKDIKKYMVEILEKIQKNGGSISDKDFSITPDLYFGSPDYFEKSRANFGVLYSSPQLVEKRVHLTKEGKKFLQDNK